MTDTRIKLIVSFLLIIAITSMKHWYFSIVVSAFCIIFAHKLGIAGNYIKKLVFPLVLALFILAVQSITYGENKIYIGTIPVYAEGLEYGFLIFARVLASASVLLLLILTIHENELLESMRFFGVPGTIIQISSFMSRYIRTFWSEGTKIKMAQESRCGFSRNSGFTKHMQNLASISGALITRAFARSEEIYRAMLSRCWKPDIQYPIERQPLNKRDTILGITLLAGIFTMLGLDRLL